MVSKTYFEKEKKSSLLRFIKLKVFTYSGGYVRVCKRAGSSLYLFPVPQSLSFRTSVQMNDCEATYKLIALHINFVAIPMLITNGVSNLLKRREDL